MANISQNVNIEMLEKLPDGTYRKKNPATKAEVVKLVDAQNKFTNKNVEGAMNELFTNVSNGKDLVGGAITDVDDSVVIPTEPTFEDLADAIGGISTGKKWASGSLVAPTGAVYFTSAGGGSSSLPRIEVIQKFGFTPSRIIIYEVVDSTGVYITTYIRGANYYSSDVAFVSNYAGGKNWDSTSRAIRVNNVDTFSSAYVSNQGFLLPVGSGNRQCDWVAFE